MGTVYVTVRVSNPLQDIPPVDVQAKVDTGATLLVLPQALAEEFAFPVIRKQSVKYANPSLTLRTGEETEERDVVWGVAVELLGRKGVFEAVVEPKKKYALLGAVVMESLDLIVEPRSLGVYPNPRSDLPTAEIE
jgi:predicted aspartyl protease